MNRTLKNLSFYILLLLVLFTGFGQLLKSPPVKKISYTKFLNYAREGKIKEIKIEDREITGKFETTEPGLKGMQFRTVAPADDKMIETLHSYGVDITVEPTGSMWWLEIFLNWLPVIVFIGFWIYILQRTNGSGSRAMSFGKSRARLSSEMEIKETFKDVAGCDEAKQDLEEIIEFLKGPTKFQKLGGRIPKGVLLVGPPGTGKTLLARAVAGEAKVPFFTISGSDFVEMFVGVGASRVRDLFYQGKKHAPCIIFIDELDAVGRQRGTGLGGGHDEREQTLNQLLVEMDGFEPNEGVILLASTNRPDVLDPALLRPGRFDREIVVDIPDLKGRLEILKVHTRKTPLADDVDLKVIARGTPGLAGADLANLVNEAALIAARHNQTQITMKDFEAAKDKIMMGTERKSRIISEDERKITAVHEAGHTLVAKFLPGSDPIHKVTVIPRGRSLGVTLPLPEKDKYHFSKRHFENQIAILLGGRAAEEKVFGDTFTGAGHDLHQATNIAHNMVCAWGMSERLGPMTFGRREEHIFLGREITKVKDYSETTAREIDQEVAAIIRKGYSIARGIIDKHADDLEKLTNALMEHETLTGDEIDRLLGIEILRRERPRDYLDELDEKGNPLDKTGGSSSASRTPENNPADSSTRK